MRALPFVALVALGLVAVLLNLSWRAGLPSTEDWAEAAGALRARVQEGDAVQPWPPWLERTRVFVDAAPVEIEEDLAHADFVGIKRLWLLSLPGAPFAHLAQAEGALRERGAISGERLRFGPLALQSWELKSAPLAGDLTAASLGAPKPTFHEVDYVSRRCRHLRIGTPDAPFHFPLQGAAGSTIHLRAGVIGEHAYDVRRPPIRVELKQADSALVSLEIPPTIPPESGWRGADAPVPAGPDERTFELLISSTDTSRPVCVAAWTTR